MRNCRFYGIWPREVEAELAAQGYPPTAPLAFIANGAGEGHRGVAHLGELLQTAELQAARLAKRAIGRDIRRAEHAVHGNNCDAEGDIRRAEHAVHGNSCDAESVQSTPCMVTVATRRRAEHAVRSDDCDDGNGDGDGTTGEEMR